MRREPFSFLFFPLSRIPPGPGALILMLVGGGPFKRGALRLWRACAVRAVRARVCVLACVFACVLVCAFARVCVLACVLRARVRACVRVSCARPHARCAFAPAFACAAPRPLPGPGLVPARPLWADSR